jgi:hypothetical protein
MADAFTPDELVGASPTATDARMRFFEEAVPYFTLKNTADLKRWGFKWEGGVLMCAGHLMGRCWWRRTRRCLR